jgi:hypothetical protein
MSLPLKRGRVVAERDRVGIAPPDDPPPGKLRLPTSPLQGEVFSRGSEDILWPP